MIKIDSVVLRYGLLPILGFYVACYGLVWFCFGGWVNYDTWVQWEQVLSGCYNEWHPFAHTFLAMKLPSFVWCDYRASVAWQLILAVGVAIHLCYSLLDAGCKAKHLLIVLYATFLNPWTIFFMMTPLKDSAFAISVLWLLSLMIRLCSAKEEAFGSPGNLIQLPIAMALCCLMRHNGIFLVAPLWGLLLILFGKRYRKVLVIVIAASIALLVGFKKVSHRIIDIKPPSSHPEKYFFIESVGMPLTLMGAEYVAHYDLLSDDTKRMMESIRSREIWNERYELGTFNVVKHAGCGKLSDEMIGEIYFPGWSNFAKMFFDTVSVDTPLAFKAWVRLTGQVWNPFDFDVKKLEWPLVKVRLWKYRETIIPIARVLSVPLFGFIPLTFIALIILSFRSIWKRDFMQLLLTIPIFCYDIGTMMFLSGFNMQRFFFCNILVIATILWYNIEYDKRY